MTNLDVNRAARTTSYDPAANAAASACTSSPVAQIAMGDKMSEYVTRAHDAYGAAGASAAQAAAAARNYGRGGITSNASTTRTFPDAKSADAAFAAQKARLADVNHWTGLSGKENATFSLIGPDGKPADRPAREGDFVKIRLPGMPVYDWVQIESVKEDAHSFAITVRPSYDPTANPPDKSVVAHFFDSSATNRFSVEKEGNDVKVRVHGENENANTGSHSGGVLHAARNRVVAEAAWGVQRPVPGTNVRVNGMQQHQWNVFTENLSKVSP